MSSTFGGLSTALSSLYAQRRGLEVTAQNVANVNTEGYNRQRVGLASVGAPIQPALFAVGDPAAGGVRVNEVKRLRDEFLESRAQGEHATSKYLDGVEQIYSKIEQIINEPSDIGLQSQMSEFWSAWENLSNEPGDIAARAELLQRGVTLTDSLGTSYSNIASLWEASRAEFDAHVEDINTTARNIAELNEAIIRAHQSGVAGNELRDRRDLLVLHLSEVAGAISRPADYGSVDVTINGSSLVNGAHARQLVAVGATQLAEQGTDPVGIRWADNGAGMTVTTGSLAAAYTTLNSMLPTMTGQLDNVASVLATTVNAQHRLGYDLNGAAGGDFFTGTTAQTIGLTFTDTNLIAAASIAGTSLDGNNASAIFGISTTVTGPDATYQKLIVDLGIASQSTTQRASIQTAIVADADSARLAQSGVSLDEEMTNLMAYQRAYEAASKVISTLDSVLETLITGLKR
ncbi:MAG: flagellar hook-associated protein FlgK [Micromonosporaceae bacterium]|nr:flagellar hook-associated protein FlgK [Micromonosporaceae bacterium]